MQNELKSAIRFDDFYAVFGSQGIVAMAWWLGAKHAEQIRTEQLAFPFLYITGRAGSGKTSLLSYLRKLNGLDSVTSCTPERATPRGLARILANAGDQTVIFETGHEFKPESKFDWDQIASLYSGGTVSTHTPSDQTRVTFKGTLVISANPPIDCGEQLESRMVRIELTASHTNESRHHAMRLQELKAQQAKVFSRAVEQHAKQTISYVNDHALAFTAMLLEKHANQLSPRNAKNGGQLVALIDALSLLLNLNQKQYRSALNGVEYCICRDFTPY